MSTVSINTGPAKINEQTKSAIPAFFSPKTRMRHLTILSAAPLSISEMPITAASARVNPKFPAVVPKASVTGAIAWLKICGPGLLASESIETKMAALIIAKKAWTLKIAMAAIIKAILRIRIRKGPSAKKGKIGGNIGVKRCLSDNISLYE